MWEKLDRQDRIALGIAAAVLGVMAAIRLCNGMTAVAAEKWWTDFFSVWADIATLGVAIWIWRYGLQTKYEASLPIKMNIEYTLNGKKIMYCEAANLADLSDARSAAQNIGAEMLRKFDKNPDDNDKKRYFLDMIIPAITINKSKVSPNCIEYDVVIPLFDSPKLLKESFSSSEDQFLLWKNPFKKPELIKN